MEVKIRMPWHQVRLESHAYFSQISQLYGGLSHDRNLPDKRSKSRSPHIDGDIAKREREDQENLRRMVDFLKMIEKARSSPACRLTLVLKCAEEQEKGKATLYARSDGRSLVPDDMVLALGG
ncbi:hypothetical protein PG985_015539 [Apiospora marii]|uniref:Uncharacterized protein n=1 Tax=Apiospora marii TaxID=335849 RepID=A0ABR1S575_9PEZI